ncbi:uncharacterized protein LOC135488205 [Lineus longissimus]|uniref:uncharacterized protein LOC135488205 n=1 Tax=Lineus longissimus TaxID=88925 RepID=UPI00315D9C97
MKTTCILLLLSLVAAANSFSRRSTQRIHADSYEDLFGPTSTPSERSTVRRPSRPTSTKGRSRFRTPPPSSTFGFGAHGDSYEDLFGPTSTKGRSRFRTPPPSSTFGFGAHGDSYEDLFGPTSTKGRSRFRTPPPSSTFGFGAHGDSYEDLFGPTSTKGRSRFRTPPPSSTFGFGTHGDSYEDLFGPTSTPSERSTVRRPSPLARLAMCRTNPLLHPSLGCLNNMEVILMVERMEAKLFEPALGFARIFLSITRSQQMPVSLLTFGQTDQALPCGWFSCTNKNQDDVATELLELARNPPAVEVPRVAYAILFGTEFPIAKRFGGQKDRRHILLMIGSGRQDPKEKASEYVKAREKARRLGVTVIYLDIGGTANTSPIKRRDVEGGQDMSLVATRAPPGLEVVKVMPSELKDVEALWKKVNFIVFPQYIK